jgi:hypothetical protein
MTEIELTTPASGMYLIITGAPGGEKRLPPLIGVAIGPLYRVRYGRPLRAIV